MQYKGIYIYIERERERGREREREREGGRVRREREREMLMHAIDTLLWFAVVVDAEPPYSTRALA